MYLHEEITKEIIGAGFEVYNQLRYGFAEKVYENSLVVELRLRGFKVETQKNITIKYKNELVGLYVADVVVEDKVIVELKSNKGNVEDAVPQLLNYLSATNLNVGLILNFGPKDLEFKRLMR
ncbi:GxxExxY protein [Alkalicella caledoniensis]|uniref:GxxExxY protein n=1 Tax=Alkalicella caledoniensis TaxID=2731377 RepID=A0A7G9WCX6_ALKCA|nr:GxxExxY protein [Alkalicella caledoniensis]QNO16538.1 GxxExxY protein [Alkalicella caledoniensis]